MIGQPSSSANRLTRIYLRSMLLTMLGSVILVGVADQSQSILILGILGVLIGWWYASQGQSGISRFSINVLLAVVVVLAGVNALKGNFSVITFVFFSILLLILKLFDLRTPRDHGQIFVLSLSLIIAAALTSNTLITGVLTFVMGFVFIRAMMLFRLYALAEVASDSTLIKGQSRFDTVASIDLRSIQVITGFVCGIGALLIFLAMPRSLGSSTLGQWGSAGASVGMTTGFADDVQLGRPGRISSSPTPVLRMTVVDRNDQMVGSENSRAIYLRGSVLNQYRNGRWVAHRDQNAPVTFRTRIIDHDKSVPIVDDNSRSEWTQEYQITFDHPDQNYGYLFTPWKPLELKSLLADARVGIDPETRMILLASQPVRSYSVRTSNPEFQTAKFPADATRSVVDTTDIAEPIKDLAQQVLSRSGIDPDPQSRPIQQDFQAVRALENHLRTQYTYTLVSEPVPSGRDATEWFLFDHRTGHCEYYASALTLLTRAVGIPARVITGYVAAEYNDVTNSFTVRESNAHAWVEAMVAPDFWRTFDGTPQSDFHDIHEPSPSLLRSVSQLYEAIEHAWIKAFIGYDSDTRSTVFGGLDSGQGLESIAVRLQERFSAGRFRLLRQALIAGGTIFVISMSLGLTLVFMKRVRLVAAIKAHLKILLTFNRSKRALSRAQYAATRLTNVVHRQLAKAGHPCPKGLPLRTHLQSIPAGERSCVVVPIEAAAVLLYRNQFGPASGVGSRSEFVLQAHAQIKNIKAIKTIKADR